MFNFGDCQEYVQFWSRTKREDLDEHAIGGYGKGVPLQWRHLDAAAKHIYGQDENDCHPSRLNNFNPSISKIGGRDFFPCTLGISF